MLCVTCFGESAAEIVPPSPQTGAHDWIGSMKNTMQILGGIIPPSD